MKIRNSDEKREKIKTSCTSPESSKDSWSTTVVLKKPIADRKSHRNKKVPQKR